MKKHGGIAALLAGCLLFAACARTAENGDEAETEPASLTPENEIV